MKVNKRRPEKTIFKQNKEGKNSIEILDAFWLEIGGFFPRCLSLSLSVCVSVCVCVSFGVSVCVCVCDILVLNRRRLVRGAIAACGIAIDFIPGRAATGRRHPPPGGAGHPAVPITQQHSRVF